MLISDSKSGPDILPRRTKKAHVRKNKARLLEIDLIRKFKHASIMTSVIIQSGISLKSLSLVTWRICFWEEEGGRGE